jgi:hypothetical protein
MFVDGFFPASNVIKQFTNFRNKLELLSLASLSRPDKYNILVGKERSLPESGAPERYFTWVGTGLTVTYIRIGWKGLLVTKM